jgi:hypothetical protein
VDFYTASTTCPGLGAWRQTVELLPRIVAPPVYDPQSTANPPLKSSAQEKDDSSKAPSLRVKTRFVLGGRFSALSSLPVTPSADSFVDRDIARILDILLERKEDIPEEPSVWKEIGVAALQDVAAGVLGAVEIRRPEPPAATPVTAPPVNKPKPSAADAPPAEPHPKPKPEPEALPRDPEELRTLLSSHLRDVDLLVLDDRDMASLLKRPETEAVVQSYIASGGSLFAFTAETGDYSRIVGVPFSIEAKGRDSNRFEIAPGEISVLSLQLEKKKVKVKADRVVPQVKSLGKPGTWRVLAFTTSRKDPRILERGGRDKEGYVALWCEKADVFHGRRGGVVSEVEAVRAKAEKYVFDSARATMLRRYESNDSQRRTAASPKQP